MMTTDAFSMTGICRSLITGSDTVSAFTVYEEVFLSKGTPLFYVCYQNALFAFHLRIFAAYHFLAHGSGKL